MDCSARDLDWLPTLDEFTTLSLTVVFMTDNNITILDENILDKWDLLNYIDLRGNPLECNELAKIQQGVEIIYNGCQTRTTRICEYTNIYIFIYNFNKTLPGTSILMCTS